MSIHVKFWGTRGSIPTPGNHTKRFGGNTPCIEVRFGNELLILDAGSGIRELGADLLKRGISPINVHLFLTHTHWDHIQGFPFFLPAYIPTTQCLIYGAREGDDRFYRLLSGQMISDYFPVRFSDLRSNISSRHLNDGHAGISDVQISTFDLAHPGGCLGYSFVQGATKIVYATDNELDSLLAKPPAARTLDGELRIIPEAMVDFVRDADLLIADGQYTDEEYPTRIGWGHASCVTAVDFAVQANVKQLAIFHHDPNRSDVEVDAIIECCRKRATHLGSKLIVFAGREGVEFKF